MTTADFASSHDSGNQCLAQERPVTIIKDTALAKRPVAIIKRTARRHAPSGKMSSGVWLVPGLRACALMASAIWRRSFSASRLNHRQCRLRSREP